VFHLARQRFSTIMLGVFLNGMRYAHHRNPEARRHVRHGQEACS